MSELKNVTGQDVESPILARVVAALGGMVLDVTEERPTQGWIRVDPARVREASRVMFEQLRGRLATVTGIDVRDGIDILYHWTFDADHYIATIKALAARPSQAIDSVGQDLPACNWIEREMHDLLGAEFRGHPDMRRLILADNWPEGVHPLRRGFKVPKVDGNGKRETQQWAGAADPEVTGQKFSAPKKPGLGRTLINVGPFHPLQEEMEFFQLYCEGETVVDMDMRTSYNHRGIEELSSRLTWDQVPFLVERVCGICSASHPWAYIRAVEGIAGIQAPPRAEYLRTIVAELERLHSHMLWLGLAGHFLGYNTVWMWAWKYREPIMDILELVTGSRIHYANNRIGGVRRDVSPDMYPEIRKALDSIKAPMEMLTKAVLDDPVLHARLKGVGVLSHEDARRWGVTGPTARASGVPIDVRRDHPHGAYDLVEWNVITQDAGDVFAKAVVRCLECFEAVKIIERCVDQIPDGPIAVDVDHIPPGEGCGNYEAPRGETFHYVRSDGGPGPVRHKIRAPSYVNIPSFKASCIGQHIADVTIILASVDPCYSCTERLARVVDADTGKPRYTFSDMVRISQERTRRLRKEV
ncbi:MAG TPA: NADH-quinone oxidoreductase subunit C [Phycisphaerae bacterium]|nr:NADH-quinone oxidoreductase subunit C [Phycisphaerae bacterium]